MAEGGTSGFWVTVARRTWRFVSKERELREEGTNSSKHLLWVSIAKTAFVRSRYRSAESGEEDHVIGGFLKDVLQSILHLCHYGDGERRECSLRPP